MPASAPLRITIDAAAVRAGLRRCRVVMGWHAASLDRLDAVLGDGDHGTGLVLGFRSVDALLDELPADTPPGEILCAAGDRLATSVGGASGPLYGAALRAAGTRAGDRAVIQPRVAPALLEAAALAVARTGGCAVGDKTILDTLRPAADALRDRGTWSAVVGAASRGAIRTRPLVARRGLATRLGAGSVGHLDPGAVSCALLLRALGDGQPPVG